MRLKLALAALLAALIAAPALGDSSVTPQAYQNTAGSKIIPVTPAAPLPVTVSTTPSAGVAPVVSTALESSHVLKASAGSMASLTVSIGTTAGYLLVFDATSAPADGSVTPVYFAPIQTNGTNGGLALQWFVPEQFLNGIVVVFSTTGPFTKTASATAAFSAQVQ